MTLIILYLLGALAVSFLCSVLEAVLLSTPVSFISMKQSQGARSASLLMNYKTNVDRPVAAILTLNTVAHTIGAAGVGSESVKVFGEAYFGIISAVLTLLILVLSEIIPKTIGASYWRKLALPSARLIRILIIISWPLVRLSELLTRCFSPRVRQLAVSREEVAATVSVGVEEGEITTAESRLIHSLLHSPQLTARDIMTLSESKSKTSPALTVTADTPAAEILARMIAEGVSDATVTDDCGRTLGTVTMEAVAEALFAAGPTAETVAETPAPSRAPRREFATDFPLKAESCRCE